MSAFDDLMAFQRETEALSGIAGLLSWDQEAMMPRGGAAQRAEAMGAIESVLHARRTDPRMADWLAAIDDAALDATGRAKMRHIRRDHARAVKVPAALAAEIARVTSRAQGVWAEARAAEDFAAFAPVLAEVVALRREEAAALAETGTPYDALLDDYEPGATGAELEALFGRLRPRLVALQDAVLDRPQPEMPRFEFAPEHQMHIAREMAAVFGYDFTRGRIDKSVHPFSSGSGDDVRITTRVDPRDPFNCFYSTIHEVGHATYEQGIDPAYRLTPLGHGVSMGVHESQSRIVENQLGRGRPFTGWLYGRMRDLFGDFAIPDAETFHRLVNRVHRGFIRTEADEVQYNLHVLLRFDLERALVAGSLAVNDLEDAWNARFEEDFGYAVDRPANGVLQDVHWSVGLFGYFPTYTLGNVYAGCLYQALRDAVPTLDVDLARGDAGPAMAWLRQNVQRHGGLYTPRALIERATGHSPTEAPLLDYLEAKFGAA
ncbi:carboxypeptidase M32 [Maritimibacter sp. 55A14]|uniref:carboxypeptidase M32 n=1 Tax=Maritimibacter sp. 55A14 TaxID=2174844 RepID=UPI000D6058AB|nr:carboxypeptidase M32 [Maritimibacter sp. 55A14]PWE33065.1 carboxypeptidase M32 [Maritimibacter sp. 55A14]